MKTLTIESRINQDQVNEYVELGFNFEQNPIIIDSCNQIIDGCHRLLAAQETNNLSKLNFRIISWEKVLDLRDLDLSHEDFKNACIENSTSIEIGLFEIEIL